MADPKDFLQPPLIADGNLPHWLTAQHPSTQGTTVPDWNTTHPERVMAAHQAFHQAGARLLRTNTQGADRLTLSRLGLEERCEAINNSGAALLQTATDGNCNKMGVVGQIDPTGSDLAANSDERERAYSEQLVFLSDTGVTFFLLDHFDSLEEARMVVRIAARCSDAPVLGQLRLNNAGQTKEGVPIVEAARMLVSEGVGAVGIACSPNWDLIEKQIPRLLQLGVPVSVMPGVETSGNPSPFPNAPQWSPSQYAENILALAHSGVSILGGCCGITPEHTQALSSAIGLRQ